MQLPPYSYLPDSDDENRFHISRHGLEYFQIEEVYYSEGIYKTLVLKNKKNINGEKRIKLLGVDAAGTYIKIIIALNNHKHLWRCVTAIKMNENEKKLYLKYVGVKK